MLTFSELRAVEAEWGAGGEWTFEGGLNGACQVDADGTPPVIHRTRVMAREASGRANVNLGGIAEVNQAFVPWDESFFVF